MRPVQRLSLNKETLRKLNASDSEGIQTGMLEFTVDGSCDVRTAACTRARSCNTVCASALGVCTTQVVC